MKRRELLDAIKERLQRAHGKRLRGVVLYGSEARGDAGAESDIDVLVLLDGPVRLWDDLSTSTSALYDLVLELERPIHAKPVDAEAYETRDWPLYRNARAEGLTA